ncbi:MAG: hypothetical protein ACRDV3_13485 [Acidothermaceae bacterium]
MDDNIEQLRETFAAHEHLAPNSIEVLEKANALARSYRRRRRAAQATGASVLGAGIVVGSVALPGLKLHPSSTSGTSTAAGGGGSSLPASSAAAAASGSATPSASAAPAPSPTYSQQQELSEYFADGFDYNNATALVSLWHETDMTKVKAKAGLLLLQGSSLPVTPNGTPESAAQKQQDQDLDAYFAAGYDYNDALSLGTLWNETDVLQIKVEAGQKLLAGQPLPIAASAPSGSSTAPTPTANVSLGPGVPNNAQSKALAAYFAAGYNYDDALSLGKLWNETDLLQIKVEAGQKLVAGQTLPIKP